MRLTIAGWSYNLSLMHFTFYSPLDSMIRIARMAMYFCLCGWGIALMFSSRVPPVADIYPSLLEEPVQTAVEPYAMTVTYGGREYAVTVQAEYDIRGLVVSHNDPTSWYRFDLTHDTHSLNLRDICLVWGENLKNDGFRRIHFYNDDTACFYDYSDAVESFNLYQFANNHLVSADESLRDTVNNLAVGDQVHIRGKLVNYQELPGGRAQATSITRFDTGERGAEIVLPENIEVIRSYNQLWHRFATVFLYSAIVIFFVRLVLFFIVYTPKKDMP